MKMKLPALIGAIIVLVLTASASTFAQTITYVDNFAAEALTLNGTLNGKVRYSNATPIDIYWVTSHPDPNIPTPCWVVVYQNDLADETLFHNQNATPIPPSTSYPDPGGLPLGGWVDSDANDGTDLTSITGSGTQSALPVKLVAFTAAVTYPDVTLDWQTASELDNEGFEVQRSEDGVRFRSLGFVGGYGTTELGRRYGFTDRSAAAGATYYYRLKQMDFDGAFEYSDQITATVRERKDQVGEFFPNPVVGERAELYYTADFTGSQPLVVSDLKGNGVLRQQLTVREGSNKVSLNVAPLRAGMYLVRIGEGASAAYRKLVIR